jgi:secondary thiamine-phosphate synthase enzyme
MSRTLSIRTQQRSQLIDITDSIAAAVRDSGAHAGRVDVFVPHTTAAVTINENADPDVIRDILADLDRLLPETQPYYRHAEGNSSAHLRASLFGASETVLIEDGRLLLGTWQGIYFCEFDGPRSRRVFLRIVQEEPAR